MLNFKYAECSNSIRLRADENVRINIFQSGVKRRVAGDARRRRAPTRRTRRRRQPTAKATTRKWRKCIARTASVSQRSSTLTVGRVNLWSVKTARKPLESSCSTRLLIPPCSEDAGSCLKTPSNLGEAPAWQLAYLTDRIRVLEGRPQVVWTYVRLGRATAGDGRLGALGRAAGLTG